jgi:hypothetical protein
MLKYRRRGQLAFYDYLAMNRFPVDYPKYTESSDRRTIIIDRVLYYERLPSELGEVFGQLGIPFNGSLGVYAKGHYRTDRRPYQDVYTPMQATLVDKLFRNEIAMHGYSYWVHFVLGGAESRVERAVGGRGRIAVAKHEVIAVPQTPVELPFGVVGAADALFDNLPLIGIGVAEVLLACSPKADPVVKRVITRTLEGAGRTLNVEEAEAA